MDLNQFKKDAIRTESRIEVIETDVVKLELVLLMFIMSGNLLDKIKKNVFYGKPIDPNMWDSNLMHIQGAVDSLINGTYLPLTKPTPLNVDTRIFHAIIGLATESTELCEALMQAIMSGKPFDSVNLQEEIGDLSWYEAILIDALGADWEQILNAVIAKLRARYPTKFTSEDAINRNVKDERGILEESLGGDATFRAEEDYPFGGSDYA